MNFGSDKLKQEVVPDVFAGKKFVALAISEAFAGSDVAGLRCDAVFSFHPLYSVMTAFVLLDVLLSRPKMASISSSTAPKSTRSHMRSAQPDAERLTSKMDHQWHIC